jgi:hypothetical protein
MALNFVSHFPCGQQICHELRGVAEHVLIKDKGKVE